MKTDRLIGIITTIQQKGTVTAPYLAEKFGVSRRTINRDIEDICKAGIPLLTKQGAGGGISIMEGFSLDAAVLTRQELSAVLTGLRSLDSVSKAPASDLLAAKLGADTDIPRDMEIDLASFYKNDLAEKIETIRHALELGMEVCSGGIIGMGETIEDRVDLALTVRELGVKSIPMNVLNPIPGTPLEGAAPLADEEVLTTVAVFRFIHPDAFLRFAGGRALIAHIEEDAIRAGINSAIVGDLLTTIGSKVIEDMEKVKRLGFTTEDNL